jgi:hypothetical protein
MWDNPFVFGYKWWSYIYKGTYPVDDHQIISLQNFHKESCYLMRIPYNAIFLT